MSNVKSVMIVGVGGQGTLLASRVLGSAMLSQGVDVKVSEVHGMSQRGGSVVTYVRYGDKVYSPIIAQGEADVLLAFEALEAARYLPWLKPEGTVVVNTHPKDILGKVREQGVKVVALDALGMAEEAGSSKAVNVVLIGAMAKKLDLPKEVWIDTIKETVPSKFIDMNLKAFELGYNADV